MTCPQCREGFVLPGDPNGAINEEFQGAYLAPSPDGESLRAIVYLTDGFGLPLKNCKIMADKLAEKLQCDVWIPDYFKGRPLVPKDFLGPPDRVGVKMSFWAQLKFYLSMIPNIPAFIASRPAVVDERVTSFINLLKQQKNYQKIGAVGYCYGGSTVVRLGSSDLVQSIVICHPGGFSVEQLKAIKVPASWACAEEDFFFPGQLHLSAEAIFAERQGKNDYIEYEFKIYPGTTHGFASRPNLNDTQVKEAHEKSFDQTIEWFRKTIPV